MKVSRRMQPLTVAIHRVSQKKKNDLQCLAWLGFVQVQRLIHRRKVSKMTFYTNFI